MFKAKLIVNPSFVFFRKHTQLLSILSLTLATTIINILILGSADKLVLLFAVPVYFLIFYVKFLIGGKYMNSIKHHRFEIDNEAIKLLNKAGTVDFEILISSIDSINLQNEYRYEDSFGKELMKQIKGIANFHFIQVHSTGQWHTLRFMLDSLYMEVRLDEIIQRWKALGIPTSYSGDPINGSDATIKLEVVK